jgi:hypothetical protein
MPRRPSAGAGTVGEALLCCFDRDANSGNELARPSGLARKEGEAMLLTSDTLVQCFFFFCFFLSPNGAVV